MFAIYLGNNGIEAETLITVNKMRPVIDSWYLELTYPIS
jgi:hypothetical protein